MIYVLFVGIALASVCLMGWTAARMGVFDPGEKLKIYKPCADENVVPYRGKKLILLIAICFVITLTVQICLYMNTATVSFIKLYGVLLLTMCAGIVDSKRRIIPNLLILLGLIFRVGIYVYEIFFADNLKAVFFNDLIGFAVGFVFLALISILTRGALGFGDVKLFGVIGLTTGAFCTYSTLLAALIVSVVVAVVNIARKKMGRKDSFPFGPCIAVGYIITVVLASY